jgi:hypothetical protein
MGAGSDSVVLTEPAGELLVEVAGAVYAEVVYPQTFGVGAGPGDPGIFHAPAGSRYTLSACLPGLAPANPRRVPMSVIALLETA